MICSFQHPRQYPRTLTSESLSTLPLFDSGQHLDRATSTSILLLIAIDEYSGDYALLEIDHEVGWVRTHEMPA